MASDLDIWRAATLLIEQHGDHAPVAALERHAEMLVRDDHEGADLWWRIRRAIAELQAQPSGPVH